MSLARGQSGYISEDVILESDAEPSIHDYVDRVSGGSSSGSGHESVFRRLSGHDQDREDVIRRQEELEREGGSMRGGVDDDGRSIGASTAGLMGPGMGVSHAMMQGMTGGFVGRNYFDYSQLETWAQNEKVLLGVGGRTPGVEGGPTGGLGASPSFSKRESLGGAVDENLIDTSNMPISPTITPPEEIATPEHTFVRRRQRKLSHSNPNPHARRQGKLALFEGGGGGGGSNTMTGGSGASILGGNNNVKGPSSPLLPTSSRDSNTYDTFSKPSFLSQPMPINPNHHQLGNGNLRDRPYRFSFYSNALPATIHARSLSELPAEGQSFEDLFTGRGGANDEDSIHQGGGNGNGNAGPSSGTATPLSYDGGGGAIPMPSAKESLLSRAMGNRNMLPPSVNGGDGSGGLPKPDDVEASTWWLDVLCPTDDEMKMLSRVSRSFFSSSLFPFLSFLALIFSVLSKLYTYLPFLARRCSGSIPLRRRISKWRRRERRSSSSGTTTSSVSDRSTRIPTLRLISSRSTCILSYLGRVHFRFVHRLISHPLFAQL